MNKADKAIADYALVVQGLTYGFTEENLLFNGLDINIAAGEFVALLAPSGIGKTTLFRLLAGQLQPIAGKIRIGEAATGAGRIGYMPQRDCLMPWRTVLENAVLGLELSGTSKREARRKALALLPQFGLAGKENCYPHELSGGMRQRVSFLRSLLGGSSVLLLDEPFGALDAMMRIQMQEWLLNIWDQHRKTILFITHDVDEALLLADRVLVTENSPVSKLHELNVDLPRPRSYDAILDDPFITLKRQALALLGRNNRQEEFTG